MDGSLIGQLLVSGICSSFILLLTSLGLVIIMGYMKVVNMAHTEMLMVGAFICYYFYGQRQWLEIGMVVAQNPKLIILDEPTAGMTADETYKTGEMIKKLKGTHTLIVVEHDMDFVRQVAEYVTVLNYGELLAEGTLEEVQNNSEVIAVYLKED